MLGECRACVVSQLWSAGFNRIALSPDVLKGIYGCPLEIESLLELVGASDLTTRRD